MAGGRKKQKKTKNENGKKNKKTKKKQKKQKKSKKNVQVVLSSQFIYIICSVRVKCGMYSTLAGKMGYWMYVCRPLY